MTDSKRLNPMLIALLSFLLLICTYFVVRYRGNWGENDTFVLTEYIRAMVNSESLVPSNAYPQGYGYPAISTFLIKITGLNIANFQLIFVPFLTVWVIIPAWLLYREFLGSTRGATLAAIILFIQPEFLFVLLRSSHEKFTRGIMLLGFYLLLRSLRSRQSIRNFAAYVVAFYMTSYALITLNNLMATSYIIGIGLAMVGIRVLGSLRIDSAENIPIDLSKRLFYTIITSLLIAFVTTFYAYQPATRNMFTLASAWERVVALVLDFNIVSSDTNTATSTVVNPYASIRSTWSSVPVYLIFTISNWLILVVSFIVWGHQTIGLFRHRSKQLSAPQWLLWALYGAFGLLSALSIILDISGWLAGNLQIRIFPSFGILAAPLLAQWLLKIQPQTAQRQKVFRTILASLVAILMTLSLLKSTNEPVISNNWMFSVQGELDALYWVNDHVQNEMIWTDYSDRLRKIYPIIYHSKNLNRLDGYSPNRQTNYFMISQWEQLRQQRLDVAFPIDPDDVRIYDNGQATIYHRPSTSPYDP